MNKLTYYGATTLTLLSIGLLSNGYHADAKQQTSIKVYHFNKSHHQYKLSNAKNVKYSGKANLGKSIKYHGKNYYYLSKIKGYISLNDFNKINDHYAKQQKQSATKTETDALEYPKYSAATSATASAATSTASSASSASAESNNGSNINNSSAPNNYIFNPQTTSETIVDDGYNENTGRITDYENYHNALEKSALDRINQYRAFKGLSPLKIDYTLDQIAYIRAKYVARTGNGESNSKYEDSNTDRLAVRFGLSPNEDDVRILGLTISNGVSKIIDPSALGKKLVDESFTFSDEESVFDSSNTKLGMGVAFNYVLDPSEGNGVVFLFS